MNQCGARGEALNQPAQAIRRIRVADLISVLLIEQNYKKEGEKLMDGDPGCTNSKIFDPFR